MARVDPAEFQALLDAKLEGDNVDLVPDDVICFKPQQIAKLLGVSYHWVLRLLSDGRLPFVRVHGRNGYPHRRVTLRDLRRYLRGETGQGGEPEEDGRRHNRVPGTGKRRGHEVSDGG